jgi:hypothetical protein
LGKKMKISMNTYPAMTLIEVFGTVSEVARVLGVDKSTVSRWQVGPDMGGTSGRIPQKYWPTLLAVARKRKLKLSLRDLAGI